MSKKLFLLVAVLLVSTLQISNAKTLNPESQKVFAEYIRTSQGNLTTLAAKKLAEKYPDEDWGSWNFPGYVFTGKTTETSYKIAVKEPRLLGVANISNTGKVIPCYCSCDNFGHENLLYCFFKDGNPNGKFDDHGSMCSICMRQAFLAFLWSELGADHEEIMKGMEKQFAPLIERREKNK